LDANAAAVFVLITEKVSRALSPCSDRLGFR
jgi:hypothetical protein